MSPPSSRQCQGKYDERPRSVNLSGEGGKVHFAPGKTNPYGRKGRLESEPIQPESHEEELARQEEHMMYLVNRQERLQEMVYKETRKMEYLQESY